MNLTRDERARVRAMVMQVVAAQDELSQAAAAKDAANRAWAAKHDEAQRAFTDLRQWLAAQPAGFVLTVGGYVVNVAETFASGGLRLAGVVNLDPPAALAMTAAAPEPEPKPQPKPEPKDAKGGKK